MSAVEDLKARLEAAKARRAAAESSALAARAESDLLLEVETAEREAKDAEAIATAEAKHGRQGKKIAVILTDMGAVIVKRPHHVAYKAFTDLEEIKSADLDKLIRPCVVYPDASALDKILEELPGTLNRCADAVCYLAGARKGELAKK